MAGTTSDWRDELGHWLRPFLDRDRDHDAGGRNVRMITTNR